VPRLPFALLVVALTTPGVAGAQPASQPSSAPTSQPSSSDPGQAGGAGGVGARADGEEEKRRADEPPRTPEQEEDLSIEDPEDDGWVPPAATTEVTPSPATALTVEPRTTLSARAQLRLAADTWHEGPRPGQPGGYHEDVMELNGQALVTLDHRARSWLRLKVGGRLLYWLTTRRPEGSDERFLLFNGSLHRNELELDLLDTYAAVRATSWLDVTAGYMTQVWGVTDLVNPNDVLAPRDLRFGAFLDPETARLPTTLVRAEAYLPRGLNAAFYFLPVFTPHRVEMFGGDFSVLGPAAPTSIQWLGSLADGVLDDSIEGLAQDALIQTRRPRPFTDPSLAARIGWSRGGWDLALCYAWLFERQPVMRIEKSVVPGLLPLFTSGGSGALTEEELAKVVSLLVRDPLPLESIFLRQHHGGLSVSGSIWELAVNLDVAYQSRSSVPLGGAFPLEPDPDDDSWLVTSFDSQTVAYTAGLTYTRGEEILVTLEWWHTLQVDLMLDDDPPELLLGEPHAGGLALLARYRLQRPVDLTFQLLVHSDVINRALILTPQVTYRHGDHLGVVAGVNLFEGSEESLSGRLDQNDQVFVGVEGYL
jgi:hypothetical protein